MLYSWVHNGAGVAFVLARDGKHWYVPTGCEFRGPDACERASAEATRLQAAYYKRAAQSPQERDRAADRLVASQAARDFAPLAEVRRLAAAAGIETPSMDDVAEVLSEVFGEAVSR